MTLEDIEAYSIAHPPALLRPGWAGFRALGTDVSLTVSDAAALDTARAILEDELAAIDRACSRFRDDSDLARINAEAGHPVAVSMLCLEAVSIALAAAEVTDGDVDPTCGLALINLGYDRDFAEILRDGTAIRHTRAARPDWRAVDVDISRGTVTIASDTRLDLGATAKALAADRAADRIKTELGCGTLVNLGGDIAMVGDAPEGGWTIKIAESPDGSDGPAQWIRMEEGGLATSGTSARAWKAGGRLLHHIISPRTGLEAQTCWRAVTVAAQTCVQANVASTCAIVRSTAAIGWLTSTGMPARLVRNDGTVLTTGEWPADMEYL